MKQIKSLDSQWEKVETHSGITDGKELSSTPLCRRIRKPTDTFRGGEKK